jgi:hypothetical protein
LHKIICILHGSIELNEHTERVVRSFWNFSPVGVGASKVEKSYPLARMIARITVAGSPFERKK